MNVFHFEPKPCEKIRRYLDSYLSNELLVETNHEVIRHLESCKECAAELEARARVKELLQRAVQSQAVPADLSEKIQKRLRGKAVARPLSIHWSRGLMAAAALLLLTLGGLVGLRAWQTAQAAKQTATVLKIGVDDHLVCAIDHHQAENVFTPEQMEQKMGSDYIGLVSLVKRHIPPGYEITVAHRCRVNGRRFVHMILKKPDVAVSLAITRRDAGESFPTSPVAAALNASGITLYEARMKNMEVAGFETPDYLAFVVSDLTKKDNLQIASQLAPPVRDFLAHVEGSKLNASVSFEEYSAWYARVSVAVVVSANGPATSDFAVAGRGSKGYPSEAITGPVFLGPEKGEHNVAYTRSL